MNTADAYRPSSYNFSSIPGYNPQASISQSVDPQPSGPPVGLQGLSGLGDYLKSFAIRKFAADVLQKQYDKNLNDATSKFSVNYLNELLQNDHNADIADITDRWQSYKASPYMQFDARNKATEQLKDQVFRLPYLPPEYRQAFENQANSIYQGVHGRNAYSSSESQPARKTSRNDWNFNSPYSKYYSDTYTA